MKVTITSLTNLQDELTAVSRINNNISALATAIENTLSRDGTSPNTMGASLDMNSNRIINLPEAVSNTEPVRYAEWRAALDGAGAPTAADYLVKTANSILSAERVVTDNNAAGGIVADWSVAEQVKFKGYASAADKYLYSTGANAWAEGAITAFGRSLIDDTDAASAKTTLSLVIGTDVQAYNANLGTLSTGSVGNWKVVYTNGSAAMQTLTVGATGTALCGNGVTAAPSWQGVCLAANNLSDLTNAATARTNLGGLREPLAANRTYYVRTDGSNSNTGLVNSAGGSFLTIQKALDVVFGTLDLAGYDVTIQVGNGTYGAFSASSPQTGAGNITVIGDTTTPSNVTISAASACVQATGFGTKLRLSGLKFTSSGSSGVYAGPGGFLEIVGKCEFGSCATHHIYADVYGVIRELSVSQIISGGAVSHFFTSGGAIHSQAMTWTLTGTPAFSGYFAYITGNGSINSYANTVASGSATGARYSGLWSSSINTNGGGANYFPGNSAGSVDATSSYS